MRIDFLTNNPNMDNVSVLSEQNLNELLTGNKIVLFEHKEIEYRGYKETAFVITLEDDRKLYIVECDHDCCFGSIFDINVISSDKKPEKKKKNPFDDIVTLVSDYTNKEK